MNSAIIVGAGPVGVLVALGLAQIGWKVTLLEKFSCPADVLPESYDDRQLALSYSNVRWLVASGLLPNVMRYLTPIVQIHTSAQDSIGLMVMDAQEQEIPALGYTIAMDQLGQLLFSAIRQEAKIDLIDEVQLTELTQQDHVVVKGLRQEETKEWQADYLFAADGMNSWVRSVLGIGLTRHDYDHGLMTAIATLQSPHHYRAVERFTPQGPTALLPMMGTHLAKVVFGYPLSEKDKVQSATPTWLTEQINHQLGRLLGNVVGIHAIKHYVAADVRPDYIVEQRCLLIGNAAHTQHPIAGQGLNLGMRDITALLAWAKEPQLSRLAELAQQRQQDHLQTMRFTSGLNHLFTHPSHIVRQLSGVGIGMLQACSPLKRFVTRFSIGGGKSTY